MPVANPSREEYLKCNLQRWKLASKDTPPQGMPTRISLPTLGLRIFTQKRMNEKYNNCSSKYIKKKSCPASLEY